MPAAARSRSIAARRSAADVMSASAASICWFRSRLLRRLFHALPLRLQSAPRAREIVREDLQLRADLAGAAIGRLRRVDDGRPHEVPSDVTNDAPGWASCFAAASSVELAR